VEPLLAGIIADNWSDMSKLNKPVTTKLGWFSNIERLISGCGHKKHQNLSFYSVIFLNGLANHSLTIKISN
jgi:hypothetical protein